MVERLGPPRNASRLVILVYAPLRRHDPLIRLAHGIGKRSKSMARSLAYSNPWPTNRSQRGAHVGFGIPCINC